MRVLAIIVAVALAGIGPAPGPVPIRHVEADSISLVDPAPQTVTIKTFKNCTKLNKVYPHGVGKRNAVDKTSGSPKVTNFFRSKALYKANKKSDRDGDGIACEKR